MSSVLILAGDTDGNLGDRAILFATCCELEKLDPEVSISIVSGKPQQDSDELGVITIPRGIGGLVKMLRTASNSDLVLIGGGGLFQDDTSIVKMPYWALRIALVRLFAKRIVGYSLGVGPLHRISSRLSARLAFTLMERVSVRDVPAQETASRCSRKSIRVVPDPALLLKPAAANEAVDVLESAGLSITEGKLLGVALRGWVDTKTRIVPQKYTHALGIGTNKELLDAFGRKLARTLDRVVYNSGAQVVFLPSYNATHEGDSKLSRYVMAHMQTEQKTLLELSDPRLYKAVTMQLQGLLGGRMHPTILAAAAGIPVVGLGYNQKFRGFFESLELRQHLIDVEEYLRQDQTEQLAELLLNSMQQHIAANPVTVRALQNKTTDFLREIAGLEQLHGRNVTP